MRRPRTPRPDVHGAGHLLEHAKGGVVGEARNKISRITMEQVQGQNIMAAWKDASSFPSHIHPLPTDLATGLRGWVVGNSCLGSILDGVPGQGTN